MITRALSVMMTTWRGSDRVVITIPLQAHEFHVCKVTWADNELKIVGHIGKTPARDWEDAREQEDKTHNSPAKPSPISSHPLHSNLS